ncbi:MAG: alpha/beta hydrolase [Candidatus Liptonbacteria bacterium]|nr:alpha/beta hydrolase [Candidatus Liptonbacteria bacterium]
MGLLQLGLVQELFYMIYFHVLVVSNVFKSIVPDGKNIPINPQKTNVVLVYGYTGTPNTFITMEKKLKEKGYNVLIPDIGWAVGDINDFSDKLARFLDEKDEELRVCCGMRLADLGNKFVLLGHSMGGLIVLNAQRRHPEYVGFPVITMGSPIRGTWLAYFEPWSTAVREMQPRSSLIKSIRQDVMLHPRKMTHIRGSWDELVPYNNSAFDGYPVFTVYRGGHAALIYNPPIEELFYIFNQSR